MGRAASTCSRRLIFFETWWLSGPGNDNCFRKERLTLRLFRSRTGEPRFAACSPRHWSDPLSLSEGGCMGNKASRATVSVWALALFLSLEISAFAQFDRGQISGFVKDPTGLFVPGASVTVLNEATKISRSIVTETNGFYVVPGLDVGYYTVTAELTGFKKYVKEKIKVDANAKVALDVVLEIGSQTEVVTVSAQTSELQKDSSQLGRIIDSGQIQQLVVFGRNPQNLVRLKAGVRGDRTLDGQSNSDGGFNIAGSRGDENVVIQDGAVLTRTRSAG